MTDEELLCPDSENGIHEWRAEEQEDGEYMKDAKLDDNHLYNPTKCTKCGRESNEVWEYKGIAYELYDGDE